MTYKTHLSTGLLFSAGFFLFVLKIKFMPIVFLMLIISTIIGAAVPDLDTPTGKIWHKIPAGGLIGRMINPVFLGGHRHLSHSVLGLGIFSGLFWLIVKYVVIYFPVISDMHYNILIAFVLGYISHLIADMFTESGIPLLFPQGYHFGIPPAPFEKVRIKTGRWFENLVVYPIVNIALALVIYNWIR